MLRHPIDLTPIEARILARCSLHYHFARQTTAGTDSEQAALDRVVRETIQQLHAAGGPARLPLERCLEKVAEPAAHRMIEHYYHHLAHDWRRLIAGNEPLELRISLAGIPIILTGTVDRLDRTSDGGILAILFRTENGPLPSAEELREDYAMTIYHALVAANYPHKRPVRLQELWLQLDQSVTIELSEEEYRANLSQLREPIQDLARSQVRARPGLHCDVCPFKHRGCPVYANEQNQEDNFASSPPAGKILPRKWTFKI
jgi:hypothetical protein